MKVLLTGATGFLGYRTLEKLVQDERINFITATGRTLKKTHEVVHAKVTYVLGDLADSKFVDQLVKDNDVIVHAAALSSPWGKKELFINANILPQQNLIASALRHQVKRFVYVSTPSIYFEYKDKFNITENDPIPTKFVNAYARTKYEAEKQLEASGLTYIILRPRALTGRGDTVIMPRLIKAHQEGRLKIIGDGKNVADLTAVSNVALAIQLAVHANEEARNQAYNITNGEPVVLWNAIGDVLRQLKLNPPVKKINDRLVRVVAAAMELMARLTGKSEPTLTQYGVGTLARSMTFDITKAKTLLKYNPEMSTQEAIQEFSKWYLENEKSTTLS